MFSAIVGLLSLTTAKENPEGPLFFVGLLVLFFALWVKQKSKGVFGYNFALASSFCAHWLLIGAASGEQGDLFSGSVVALVLLLALLKKFSDKAHQFISASFFAAIFFVMPLKSEFEYAFPLVYLVLIPSAVCCIKRYPRVLDLRPLGFAFLMVLGGGVLGISLFEELANEAFFSFGQGVLAIASVFVFYAKQTSKEQKIFAVLSVVLLAFVPLNLGVSLLLIYLGDKFYSKVGLWGGFILFSLFLVRFYYLLSLSFLYKSAVLVVSGLFCLGLWWLFDKRFALIREGQKCD